MNRSAQRTCWTGRIGFFALLASLAAASVMTLAAEAQLPPTDADPTGTYGSNSVGQIVFFVVVAIIVGTAIALYTRHRRRGS